MGRISAEGEVEDTGKVRDTGSTCGWGGSPRGGHGNPLLSSCLEEGLKVRAPDGLGSTGPQSRP